MEASSYIFQLHSSFLVTTRNTHYFIFEPGSIDSDVIDTRIGVPNTNRDKVAQNNNNKDGQLPVLIVYNV